MANDPFAREIGLVTRRSTRHADALYTKQMRYLLFADILGTDALYTSKPRPKSELIEQKRTSLGHAVRTAVFPYFDSQFHARIHISVFSDTVLVASENLQVLLSSASRLFHVFSCRSFSAKLDDELCLLRGGIAYGQVLTSRSITSEKNVDVAQIFDTSLSLAYRLEGIRKGSRIFLCHKTFQAAKRRSDVPCHKWQAITGIGPPVSPAFEYLWPTALFQARGEFTAYLLKLSELWYRLFTARRSWAVPDYDRSLYQLDETMKVCIRSTAYTPRRCLRDIWSCLLALLPTQNRKLAMLDIRFTWGTWFQVLWMLILLQHKYPSLASTKTLRQLLRRNILVIDKHQYMPTFLGELRNPDYQWFRLKLNELEVI